MKGFSILLNEGGAKVTGATSFLVNGVGVGLM